MPVLGATAEGSSGTRVVVTQERVLLEGGSGLGLREDRGTMTVMSFPRDLSSLCFQKKQRDEPLG